MRSQYEDEEVVEWQALDEAGNPVGDPLVVRYTSEGKVVDRLRSESGKSVSISEENPLMETTVPMSPLAEMFGRLLPLAEKWLKKQVGEVEEVPETERILTPLKASKILHLHVQTVLKMCREGKLEASKICGNEVNGKGGKYLIPREAVDAYIRKQKLIHGERRRSTK